MLMIPCSITVRAYVLVRVASNSLSKDVSLKEWPNVFDMHV